MKRQIIQQKDSVDKKKKKVMESSKDINLVLTNETKSEMFNGIRF